MEENKKMYFIIELSFLIAFLPKYIQMIFIAVIFIFFVFNSKGKIAINKIMVPFFIYSVIHLISIFFNCYHNNIETSRIIAALNTALLWIGNSFIFSFVIKEKVNQEKINKLMFFNICILVVLGMAMLVLKNTSLWKIGYGDRRLIGLDWIYSQRNYRLLGFFEYSNLIVLLNILIYPFSTDYILKKFNKPIQLLFCCLSVLPIILTNSRLGILIAVALVVATIPRIISFNKKTLMLSGAILIIIMGLFCIFNYNLVATKIASLIGSRESSSSMRMTIYRESIQDTLETNFLLGCGIKTYIYNYPLGSHSTYIGLFYKAGILGFIVALGGIINLFKKIIYRVKGKGMYYVCSFMCLLVMFAIEDLDGANWYITFFFLITAILLSSKEQRSS